MSIIQYYQSIPELGIKGRMDTPVEFDAVGLPKDLTGWSALDIGSNMGAFCIEMKRRGARPIHGVEPNKDWRIIADGILSQFEVRDGEVYPIAYMDDLVNAPPSDLVLLLSVTHVIDNGQELLKQAWKKTRRLMILEVNHRLEKKKLEIPAHFTLYGKNKDGRNVYHASKDY